MAETAIEIREKVRWDICRDSSNPPLPMERTDRARAHSSDRGPKRGDGCTEGMARVAAIGIGIRSFSISDGQHPICL